MKEKCKKSCVINHKEQPIQTTFTMKNSPQASKAIIICLPSSRAHKACLMTKFKIMDILLAQLFGYLELKWFTSITVKSACDEHYDKPFRHYMFLQNINFWTCTLHIAQLDNKDYWLTF